MSGLILRRALREVRIGSKWFLVSSRKAQAGWAAMSRFLRGFEALGSKASSSSRMMM